MPKFKIGDTVYYPRVSSETAKLPCPDCLDTRRWKVITPGGTELEADCQRCSGYLSQQFHDVPSLSYVRYKGYVDTVTIGSVTVSSASRHGSAERQIEYMCNETGVGSGSIYYEERLHATEFEARADADLQASLRNTEERIKPERIEQRRIGALTIVAATETVERESLWAAWYSYRNLRETIESYLKNAKGEMTESFLADIQSELDFEKTYRDRPVFDRLLSALSVDDWTGAKALLVRLPFKVEPPKGHEVEKEGWGAAI